MWIDKVDLGPLNLIQQREFTAIIKSDGMKLVGVIGIDNRLKRVLAGFSVIVDKTFTMIS